MNKDIGAAMTNVAIVATASSASLAFLSCKKDVEIMRIMLF